ncbi:MAG: hypothetical protein PVJ86_02700 [Phycisphaerales bacterium]|jgi:hypothetical protein
MPKMPKMPKVTNKIAKIKSPRTTPIVIDSYITKWMSVDIIRTEDEWQSMGAAYKEVNSRIKKVQDEHMYMLEDIKGQKRKIDERYTPWVKAYEKIKDHLRGLGDRYIAQSKKAEKAALERKAKRAEKKGDAQKASDLRASAQMAKVAPSTGAITVVNRWKAKITDLQAFIAFVAGHEEFHDLIKINYGQLDKLAAKHHQDLKSTIPGTEAYVKQDIRER